MKFSPENWKEVKPNEKIILSQGRLWLRLTQESPVLITSLSGVETLVGFDKEIDVEVTDVDHAIFTNDQARGWLFERPVEYFESDGEVFTNADRLPMESGTVNEITSALRLFKLEQMAVLRDAHAELAEIKREAAAHRPAPTNPATVEPLMEDNDEKVAEKAETDADKAKSKVEATPPANAKK